MYFDEILKYIIITVFINILYWVITITLFHFILKLFSKQMFWKVLKLIFNNGFRIKDKKNLKNSLSSKLSRNLLSCKFLNTRRV